MPNEKRMQQVAEYKELLERAEAVIIVEYRGLTVAQMTDVRSKVREAGGEMKIGKNTLFRIALEEAGLPVPQEHTLGANAYTMVYDDVAAVAKALRDFAKEKKNKDLLIKAGILGGKVLESEQVLALADLPSREQLLGQVVGTMAGPIRGLVTVLSGNVRGLVTALSQIKEQKEKDAA
ncbi:MAG TPA: 50S ribosomal protein L10 [Synergistaceae bacterium]|nr:50S ribosomal protein L10 [Synergistaceae bacterium]HPJ26637.1 50S ribosomal protein L10 [Synergistaceae bacterium]HPQ37491.1 50S ribosomal protein L10 [Synergistaceae bacterium]